MLNPTQDTEPSRALSADAVGSSGRAGSRRVTGRERSEPTLADFAWMLVDRRWTVIAVTVAALAVAVVYVAAARPVYETSTLIEVDARTRPVPGFRDLADLFNQETPTEGEMRIMRSRAVLDPVVDELALDIDVRPHRAPIIGDAFARRYRGAGPANAPLGLTRFAWGGERADVQRLVVPETLLDEPLVLTALPGDRYRIASSDGTVLAEGAVGQPVSRAEGERRIEVLVTELTARPGTEFVLTRRRRLDILEEIQASLRISEQGRATGIVGVVLEGHDPAQIAAILNALCASYQRHNVQRTSAEAAKMLGILEAQLPVLRSNLERAETALKRFRARNGSVTPSAQAEGIIAKSAEIDRGIAENELRAAELSRRYAGQHPDLPLVTLRTEQLRTQRAAVEELMRALPELDLQFTRLSRQVNVATELYTQVLNRSEELRIVRSGSIGNARVLEQAFVPYRPVQPKPVRTLAVALLLGLAAGTILAFARQALDKGARDPHDIEEGAGLPVFATIPHSAVQRRLTNRRRGSRPSVLSVVEPAEAAVEDLRGLRTSVQFALRGARNGVVVVGGLSARAGKSFVSVNLAHLLAAADGRVLLLDADLRRGDLYRFFGVEAQPGLADIVTRAAELGTAVRLTDVPNLDFLPAGTPPRNPAELLAGEPFQQLIAELSRRYSVVVVDTPPILSVTDFALVGRHAGVNLLVVRSGDHSAREISYVVKRLAQNGVAIRGAVLNDIRHPAGRYGRYHRYEMAS